MDHKTIAVETAKQAGKLIAQHYSQRLELQVKGVDGRDFVTQADLESEKLIIASLQKEFPDYNVLAEESGKQQNNSPYTWVIDPLDGTTNFSRNLPLFSVSIALAQADRVVLGVVYNPILQELFYADETGAYLNGKPIHVSKSERLGDSILSQSFDYDNEKRKDNLKNITQIFFKVEGFRMMHSTAYDLCNVACGRMDGYVVSSSNPWDIAAGAFIVQQAGGRVTGFENEEWSYLRPRIIATNSKIHDALLKELR